MKLPEQIPAKLLSEITEGFYLDENGIECADDIEVVYKVIANYFNNQPTRKSETIIINKKKAMRNFFETYANDIDGYLKTMSKTELLEHLESDIFIGCASAASGIKEEEFINFSLEYFKPKE